MILNNLYSFFANFVYRIMSATHSSVLPNTKVTALKVIFQAGLIAGFLNVSAVIILLMNNSSVENPAILFNYIASGLIGSGAFKAGIAGVALGVALHFFISLSFAFLFYLIYPQVKRLIVSPFISGILYGLFIWFVMNFVVLRLSKIDHIPLTISDCFTGLILVMVFAGIPISFTINKYYKLLSAS